MKKFKLIVSFKQVQQLYVFLTKWVNENQQTEIVADRMAWAVLFKFLEQQKIRDKVRYHFKGDSKISMKPEEAFALSYVIDSLHDLNPADYLGNFLLKTYGDIHQYFITLNTEENGPERTAIGT